MDTKSKESKGICQLEKCLFDYLEKSFLTE